MNDDRVLAEISHRHSSDMLQRGFLTTSPPEGLNPVDRVAASHRSLVGVTGENVWSGSGYDTKSSEKLARILVEDWMDSEGHRENILYPECTHLGVGTAAEGGEVRSTQSFAGVRAFLQIPLPENVRPGDALDLGSAPYGDLTMAELFSFTSDDESEPRPVLDARAPFEPGAHTL